MTKQNRCRWSTNGKLCRQLCGVNKMCRTHRQDLRDRKACAAHEELVLPERKSWEYEPKDYWED